MGRPWRCGFADFQVSAETSRLLYIRNETSGAGEGNRKGRGREEKRDGQNAWQGFFLCNLMLFVLLKRNLTSLAVHSLMLTRKGFM